MTGNGIADCVSKSGFSPVLNTGSFFDGSCGLIGHVQYLFVPVIFKVDKNGFSGSVLCAGNS